MHMKTRITVTLDPQVVQRAKSVARSRKSSLSALIEDLLTRTVDHNAHRVNFTQKWVGKFTVRVPEKSDPLLDAMKARYDLN